MNGENRENEKLKIRGKGGEHKGRHKLIEWKSKKQEMRGSGDNKKSWKSKAITHNVECQNN